MYAHGDGLTVFFVAATRGVRRALVFIAALAREHHIKRKVGAARECKHQQEPVLDEPVDHDVRKLTRLSCSLL